MDRRMCMLVLILGVSSFLPTSGFCDAGKAVAVGSLHSCVLTINGGVKCWGEADEGQLGDGSFTGLKAEPVDVTGLTGGVVAITAGWSHTCALTSAGAVKCWGYNAYGQVGNGVASDLSVTTPVTVIGLASGVKAIDAGAYHTCAVLTSGIVKCWGMNSWGQLGTGGTASPVTTPTTVAGLSAVSEISAGGYHTCAADPAGLKCWGLNGSGELGNGSYNPSYVPVAVSGSAGGHGVAAGNAHTCALWGTVAKCWGANGSGQLGTNNTVSVSTPQQVTFIGDVTSLSAGPLHTCAVLEGTGIACWGSSFNGRLGVYTDTSPIPRPVATSGLADTVVETVAAGGTHTCAVLRRGEVQCWGGNASGQAGDGTFGSANDRWTPVGVVGLKGIAPTDADNDSRSDPMVWRSGAWYMQLSASHSYKIIPWGDPMLGDVPVPGDYNGDGRMDAAVWRGSTGTWYIWYWLDGGLAGYQTIQWGSASEGDIPVPGDYDGDGKTDPAVWRPSTGMWYWLYSHSHFDPSSYGYAKWGSGSEADIPVAADYNGDRITDPAVWRPSTGTWYILPSGPPLGDYITRQWGSAAVNDKVVPADFDGDGKADIAVWRPSSGTWYVLLSTTSFASSYVVQWGSGSLGDVPMPGDYDGDQRADCAVWRPGPGMWYARLSSHDDGTFLSWQWGSQAAGDVPVRQKVY